MASTTEPATARASAELEATVTAEPATASSNLAALRDEIHQLAAALSPMIQQANLGTTGPAPGAAPQAGNPLGATAPGEPPAAVATQVYTQQLAQAIAADSPEHEDELDQSAPSAYGPATAPGGHTGLGKGKTKAASCKADPAVGLPY